VTAGIAATVLHTNLIITVLAAALAAFSCCLTVAVLYIAHQTPADLTRVTFLAVTLPIALPLSQDHLLAYARQRVTGAVTSRKSAAAQTPSLTLLLAVALSCAALILGDLLGTSSSSSSSSSSSISINSIIRSGSGANAAAAVFAWTLLAAVGSAAVTCYLVSPLLLSGWLGSEVFDALSPHDPYALRWWQQLRRPDKLWWCRRHKSQPLHPNKLLLKDNPALLAQQQQLLNAKRSAEQQGPVLDAAWLANDSKAEELSEESDSDTASVRHAAAAAAAGAALSEYPEEFGAMGDAPEGDSPRTDVATASRQQRAVSQEDEAAEFCAVKRYSAASSVDSEYSADLRAALALIEPLRRRQSVGSSASEQGGSFRMREVSQTDSEMSYSAEQQQQQQGIASNGLGAIDDNSDESESEDDGGAVVNGELVTGSSSRSRSSSSSSDSSSSSSLRANSTVLRDASEFAT
jgi:hypothetical protein